MTGLGEKENRRMMRKAVTCIFIFKEGVVHITTLYLEYAHRIHSGRVDQSSAVERLQFEFTRRCSETGALTAKDVFFVFLLNEFMLCQSIIALPATSSFKHTHHTPHTTPLLCDGQRSIRITRDGASLALASPSQPLGDYDAPAEETLFYWLPSPPSFFSSSVGAPFRAC